MGPAAILFLAGVIILAISFTLIAVYGNKERRLNQKEKSDKSKTPTTPKTPEKVKRGKGWKRTLLTWGGAILLLLIFYRMGKKSEERPPNSTGIPVLSHGVMEISKGGDPESLPKFTLNASGHPTRFEAPPELDIQILVWDLHEDGIWRPAIDGSWPYTGEEIGYCRHKRFSLFLGPKAKVRKAKIKHLVDKSRTCTSAGGFRTL